MYFQQYFNYIMVTIFNDWGNCSTPRIPTTLHKSLFIG